MASTTMFAFNKLNQYRELAQCKHKVNIRQINKWQDVSLKTKTQCYKVDVKELRKKYEQHKRKIHMQSFMNLDIDIHPENEQN
jgi:hypothetical protein